MYNVIVKFVSKSAPVVIGSGGFIGYELNSRLIKIERKQKQMEDDIVLDKWLRNVKMNQNEKKKDHMYKFFLDVL